MEDRMVTWKRRLAGGIAGAGLLFALVCVTVLPWGLGMLAGFVAFIGGFGYLTDQRPPAVRRGRAPWGGSDGC
jgi:hypothetical protein